MSPLERAARALVAELERQHGSSDGTHEQAVRAVLEAIREPSEAMVEAAWSVDIGFKEQDMDPASAWTAMIDAVLTKAD